MERFLSINRAAELLDVSPWTVRKWLQQRRIPYTKFGGAIRIKESDLLAFGQYHMDREELENA